jgi:hypothetical protein
VQQLSLAEPQLVIPGPPGAQLGGDTPESPPLLDSELPPELLPEPDPLPPLEPLPEGEDVASFVAASLFPAPPFEPQPPETLAATPRATSQYRIGFAMALHPILRLSLTGVKPAWGARTAS